MLFIAMLQLIQQIPNCKKKKNANVGRKERRETKLEELFNMESMIRISFRLTFFFFFDEQDFLKFLALFLMIFFYSRFYSAF